jgi:hypothetical protein
MTVPNVRRVSGSCPAGCMAKVGLWWWRQQRRSNPNGGSRCQDLAITQLVILSAASMIAELNCRRPSKTKPPEEAVDKLIRAGLLGEVRAAGSLPV